MAIIQIKTTLQANFGARTLNKHIIEYNETKVHNIAI